MQTQIQKEADMKDEMEVETKVYMEVNTEVYMKFGYRSLKIWGPR